jgi:hypothetical protein
MKNCITGIFYFENPDEKAWSFVQKSSVSDFSQKIIHPVDISLIKLLVSHISIAG